METTQLSVLVQRAGEGDQSAWTSIVDEYNGLLWSVARGFRLDEAQAGDVVQTTWLRLVEHISDIREPARLPGWLKTTARRVCLESVREAGRNDPLNPVVEDAVPPWCGREDAAETGPEGSTLRAERRDLVRRAVMTLPARHQELLALLVASPALSYEEIGARLAMPVGSIGPTRARIMARLRATLAAMDFHDAALG